MLDEMSVSKVLVIAPLRVARDTWPAEVSKWDHLSDLDISIIVGTAKERMAALNHNAMIYVINRGDLAITGTQSLCEAHLYMWQGMVKTLVNAQWSVWEEDSPKGKMRIKIAKKIDKFM